jgi:sucrose-6-phosphate hydrolase SacC (GH32 family)
MKWQKKGLIFSPGKEVDWMKTHAQVPTPLVCDDFIRVYFSSRPEPTLSLTTFVDLDIDDPARILRLNRAPILELGKPGTFDEHGIMPSCAIRNGSKVFLYYSGWSRGASVPYTNSTGLAVSEDGGATFEKVSEGPILSKSPHDPYSATSPGVLHEGDAWHMWYCSGTGWIEIAGKLEHTYDIKYARSGDGLEWKQSPVAVIKQRTQHEALTRPYVIKRDDGYHMFFCYRGSHSFRDGEDAYRIGYAHSNDLQQWQRSDDQAGIVPADSGWDSRMAAYPAVVTVNNRTLMFYNGNGFGVEGFGYASLLEN